jgi:hypothetical protein
MLCISRMRPRLDVIQYRALRSPDFPHPILGRDRLADLGADFMIAHYQ